MRAAPEKYDRLDQQDVRNEITRLKNKNRRPLEALLMTDTTGKLYNVKVTTGGSLSVTVAST